LTRLPSSAYCPESEIRWKTAVSRPWLFSVPRVQRQRAPTLPVLLRVAQHATRGTGVGPDERPGSAVWQGCFRRFSDSRHYLHVGTASAPARAWPVGDRVRAAALPPAHPAHPPSPKGRGASRGGSDTPRSLQGISSFAFFLMWSMMSLRIRSRGTAVRVS